MFSVALIRHEKREMLFFHISAALAALHSCFLEQTFTDYFLLERHDQKPDEIISLL